jgi:hypothetical protein
VTYVQVQNTGTLATIPKNTLVIVGHNTDQSAVTGLAVDNSFGSLIVYQGASTARRTYTADAINQSANFSWTSVASDYTMGFILAIKKIPGLTKFINPPASVSQTMRLVDSVTTSTPFSFTTIPPVHSLMVVFVAVTNGVNITMPAGWTRLNYDASTGNARAMFWKFADGNENLWTITAGGTTTINANGYVIANADLTAPIFSITQNQLESGSYNSINAAATNVPTIPKGSVVIAFINSTQQSVTWTFSNSFIGILPASGTNGLSRSAHRQYLDADVNQNTLVTWNVATTTVRSLFVVIRKRST